MPVVTDTKARLQAIGNRIKLERQAFGYTQDCISGLCGISLRTWARYESGEREMRALDAAMVAQKFNCSIDYLLCQTDIRK